MPTESAPPATLDALLAELQALPEFTVDAVLSDLDIILKDPPPGKGSPIVVATMMYDDEYEDDPVTFEVAKKIASVWCRLPAIIRELQAVAALRAAGEWRTMESAPKDGSAIIVAGGNYFSLGYMDLHNKPLYAVTQPLIVSWYKGRDRWEVLNTETQEYHPDYVEPTHWQPLPPSPGSP